MKLYHGTSFENACQILSSDVWLPPLLPNETSTKQSEFWQHMRDKDLKYLEKIAATWFTTSHKFAKIYAQAHERPVVLCWECEDVSSPGVYTFKSNDPIDTSKVKALICKGKSEWKMAFYGGLVNALYGKGPKYIPRSNLGILYDSSLRRLKDFFLTEIDAIQTYLSKFD